MNGALGPRRRRQVAHLVYRSEVEASFSSQSWGRSGGEGTDGEQSDCGQQARLGWKSSSRWELGPAPPALSEWQSARPDLVPGSVLAASDSAMALRATAQSKTPMPPDRQRPAGTRLLVKTWRAAKMPRLVFSRFPRAARTAWVGALRATHVSAGEENRVGRDWRLAAETGMLITLLILVGITWPPVAYAGARTGPTAPQLSRCRGVPASGCTLTAASGTPVEADTIQRDWLAEINYYRQAAGLMPVTDQPAWDQGLADHLIYLANTPEEYFTGPYDSPHDENPASPYYTPAGDSEAHQSDIGGAASPLLAVDGWLAAPFHGLFMLNPELTQVALAVDTTAGSAALDVKSGVNGDSSLPSTPVLFPGPGSTTDLVAYTGETPDPLAACGWQKDTGLPLVILAPDAPASDLSATLVGPAGTESSAGGTICVLDEVTDPTEGDDYDADSGEHAIILIPRLPLANGHYSVRVQQTGAADIAWSFDAYLPPPINQAPPLLLPSAPGSTPTPGTRLDRISGTWDFTDDGVYDGYRDSDQWLRCDRAGQECVAIAGATDPEYVVSQQDVGSTIRAQQTEENLAGAGSPAVSDPTLPVLASAAVGKPNVPSKFGLATKSELRTLLVAAMMPTGRRASITAILKAGGYTSAFRAPEAGRLVIRWYDRGRRWRASLTRTIDGIIIASASAMIHGAGKRAVRVKLTRAGRNLLNHAKSERLLVQDSFTAASGAQLSVSRSTTLRRR
jgi:uncharacterized protein YkwD